MSCSGRIKLIIKRHHAVGAGEASIFYFFLEEEYPIARSRVQDSHQK